MGAQSYLYVYEHASTVLASRSNEISERRGAFHTKIRRAHLIVGIANTEKRNR